MLRSTGVIEAVDPGRVALLLRTETGSREFTFRPKARIREVPGRRRIAVAELAPGDTVRVTAVLSGGERQVRSLQRLKRGPGLQAGARRLARLEGTIRAVQGGDVQLNVPTGHVGFQLAEHTKLRSFDGMKALTAADLKPGVAVSVWIQENDRQAVFIEVR
ncbi:MAG: hypothetical protein HY554_04430 [Elusimicrobia bacterium]|nr:hypothetical protein [Elusimicrobiota bacterium]